ncbi:glycosyltransferase family 2 protein [Aurantiacibacter suaedae]|uniref:glycosyltransferase family 2 protein n=1 Tax=Aurantiacibacter suaedae TaxID=2545755 RepID=UPI00138763C9|nr:glycosyltransferase family 2 protein [Aurantiacibacter suaedae]
MTRISFIMPTFNRGHFIAESIRSITSQMDIDDELLVVDDGSTDDTPQVLQSLDEPFDHIRQENAGKSVALNRGMARTSGRYVWICDDDDILYPGAVERLFTRLEGSQAGFVFGRYTRFREVEGQREEFGTGYWPDLSQGSLARHILEDSFVMHNASLVRRSAYEQVGPFDETMLRSLDYEMFVRLAAQVPCAFEDAMIFGQRKHEGARGPSKVLHAAGESDSVWKEFDRRIFVKLREAAGLSLFEAMYRADDSQALRRAALLQRACIMARHDLWDEALDDFEHAAQASARPLSACERAICRRSVSGKHGFGGVLEQPHLARFTALYRSAGAGGAIARAVLDGLVWRLRAPEAEPRRQVLALLSQVGGVSGLPRLLLRRALSSRSAPAGAPQVEERSDIDLPQVQT